MLQFCTCSVNKPEVDKHGYRELVREWMSRLKVFANGGDTRATWISCSCGFGHDLYAAMDQPYQKIIKAEISRGALSLEPEEGDATQDYNEQRKLIERILVIFAKNSYTDAGNRKIAFGRRIFNCKRAKGEDLENFADRFHGIAQEHLNSLGHMPTRQERQSAAIILMENANPSDSSYNNLLSILVARSKESTQDGDILMYTNVKELIDLNGSIKSVSGMLEHNTQNLETAHSAGVLK